MVAAPRAPNGSSLCFALAINITANVANRIDGGVKMRTLEVEQPLTAAHKSAKRINKERERGGARGRGTQRESDLFDRHHHQSGCRMVQLKRELKRELELSLELDAAFKLLCAHQAAI